MISWSSVWSRDHDLVIKWLISWSVLWLVNVSHLINFSQSECFVLHFVLHYVISHKRVHIIAHIGRKSGSHNDNVSQLTTWPPPYDHLTTWPLDHMTTWPQPHDHNHTTRPLDHHHMTTWPHDHLTTWPLDHLTTWPLDHMTTWPLDHTHTTTQPNSQINNTCVKWTANLLKTCIPHVPYKMSTYM